MFRKKQKITKENFCCKALKSEKPKIEDCLNNLIEANTDFDKNKWAWKVLKV